MYHWLVFLLIFDFVDDCHIKINGLKKGAGLTYPPVRLNYGGPFYIPYIDPLGSYKTIELRKESKQMRKDGSQKFSGDLVYGRILEVPNSYVLGFLTPISDKEPYTGLGIFIGEVIIPLGDTPIRTFYDNAEGFLSDLDKLNAPSIHSVLYRPEDVRGLGVGHVIDLDAPQGKRKDIPPPKMPKQVEAKTCKIDVLVDLALFEHIKNMETAYFMANQPDTTHPDTIEHTKRKRAIYQSQKLVTFLVEATNKVYEVHGLRFEIGKLTVYDNDACLGTIEEGQRTISFFDTDVFCNNTILRHPDKQSEYAFVDRSVESLNKALIRSHACFKVLFTFGKFEITQAASNVGGKSDIGACAKKVDGGRNRRNSMIIDLAWRCQSHRNQHLLPLVHSSWVTSHEFGHQMGLDHVNGSYIMNPTIVDNFASNYLSHHPDSAVKLKEFISQLVNEEHVEGGGKLKNCLL